MKYAVLLFLLCFGLEKHFGDTKAKDLTLLGTKPKEVPVASVPTLGGDKGVAAGMNEGPLDAEEAEDHIPEKAFIRTAHQALASFDTFSLKNETVLDSKIVISILKRGTFTTPLGRAVKDEAIKRLSSETITTSELVECFIQAAKYWKDKSRLKQHYEDNKAAYMVKETTETILELEKADIIADVVGIGKMLESLKGTYDGIQAKEEKKKKEKQKE